MVHIEERPLGANMSQLYNNSSGMGSAVAILKQSSLHNKFALAQNENVTRTQDTAGQQPDIQSRDLDKTIFGVLSKSAMTPEEEFNTRKNLVLIGLYNFAQNCKQLQTGQAPASVDEQAKQEQARQDAGALAQDQANIENIIFGSEPLQVQLPPSRSISSYKKKR